MSDFDDILDGTLDDLADLPEFKPFPNGAHTAIIGFERKEINNHPCVEIKLKAIETIKLTNPAEDTPLEKGAEASVLYMLDNEIGQGKFKAVMANLSAGDKSKKLSDIMKDAEGSEVTVVTSKTQSKDKTKTYMDIVELFVS